MPRFQITTKRTYVRRETFEVLANNAEEAKDLFSRYQLTTYVNSRYYPQTDRIISNVKVKS